MNTNERDRKIREWKARENRYKLFAVLVPMFLYIIIVSGVGSFEANGVLAGFWIVIALGVGLRLYISQYCKKKIKELMSSDSVE